MIVAVVVSNLLYPGVALAVAVVGALIVVVLHRKPKSVESHVASFNKGLQALAPDDDGERPASRPSWGGAHRPVLVRDSDDEAAIPNADVEPSADGEPDADVVPIDDAGPDPESEPVADVDDDDDAPVDLTTRQRNDIHQAGPTEEAETG